MTGQLMTKDALDFEATTGYMVIVTATDGSAASATIDGDDHGDRRGRTTGGGR